MSNIQLPNFVNTHEPKGGGKDLHDLIIDTGVVSKVEYVTNNRTAHFRSVGAVGGAVASVAGAALEKTTKSVVRAGTAGALMSQGTVGTILGGKIIKDNAKDNPFLDLELASGDGQSIDHYAKVEFSVGGNTKRYVWRLQTPSETIDVGDVISVARRKNAVGDKGFDKKNREMKEGKDMAEILASFTDDNYPAHFNHSKNVYLNKVEVPKLSTMKVVIASAQVAVPLLVSAWIFLGGRRGGINLNEVLAYLAIIGGAALLARWKLSSDAKKQKYPEYINQAMKAVPVADEGAGISQDIKIIEEELAKTAEKNRLAVDSGRSRLGDIPLHFTSNLALPYDRTISTAPEIQVYTGVVTDIKERKSIVTNQLAHETATRTELISHDNLHITDQVVVLENGEDTYRLPSSTGFFREVLEKEDFKKNKWKLDYVVTAPSVEVGDVISVYRIETYESLEDKKSTADPMNPNDVRKYLTLAVVKWTINGQHLQSVPSPLKAWIQGRDEGRQLLGDRKKNAKAIDEKWLEILNQPVGEFYNSTK